MAEVTAVLLAEMGYNADTTVLDGDLGFWRFFGSDRWAPEALTEKLGHEWKMLSALEYKPYPCCRDFHVALDCFIKIVEENKLKPEEIERVDVQSHPSVTMPSHMTKEILNHIDAQFSLPYCIAVAANKVNLPEWQDPDTINDPKVQRFMEKVFPEAHPQFFEVQQAETGSIMTTIEVIARNRTYKEEGKFARGSSNMEFTKMTDEELVKKFRMNASRALAQNKVDKAVASLTELENVKNISQVMKQVRL